MRVQKVTKITLQEPIPVYDITVPGTENFCLAAGPVVHNSKDVADAVCGVASFLLTRRAAWTQQPSFMGQGGYMLHGNRTVHDGVNLTERADEEDDSARRKVRRTTVRRKPVRRATLS